MCKGGAGRKRGNFIPLLMVKSGKDEKRQEKDGREGGVVVS